MRACFETSSSFPSRRSSWSSRSRSARGKVSRRSSVRGVDVTEIRADEATGAVNDAFAARGVLGRCDWEVSDTGEAVGASRGGSGRLAVRSDSESHSRVDPWPRATRRWMVVPAEMRSSRSVRSGTDRIGWPFSVTIVSPGRSPARPAGVPGRTCRRRAPSSAACGSPGRATSETVDAGVARRRTSTEIGPSCGSDCI